MISLSAAAWAIIALLIVDLVFGIYIAYRSTQLWKILSKNKTTNITSKKSTDGKQINFNQNTRINADSISCRRDYNDIYVLYESNSRIIPLFPIMGILGTVWGLHQGMNGFSSTADINSFISGLTTALDTTIVELSASLVLKICETYIATRLTEIDVNYSATSNRASRLTPFFYCFIRG